MKSLSLPEAEDFNEETKKLIIQEYLGLKPNLYKKNQKKKK